MRNEIYAQIAEAIVSQGMSRRRFFAAGAATLGPMLLGPAEAATHSPMDSEQAQKSFAAELEARLSLTRANAEAMAMRALRSVGRPGAMLVGDRNGEAVEILDWERHLRSWQLRSDPDCDVSLANAVGLASPGAATVLITRGASLRWISSCHFGGAVCHVLRHARGVMFLVTTGTGHVAPRRVDIA